MTTWLTALLAAALFASAASSNSTVCSNISNSDCQCTNISSSSSSSSSGPDIRCTFTAFSAPSPLFSSSSFARSVQLGTLDLSGNNLDRLPDDFFQQESVEVLNLKDNRLGEVPAVLRKLRSLRTLDLSHNAVRSLGLEVLGAVAGLQKVDMSGNRLTSLSEEDGPRGQQLRGLENLRELKLARNSIGSLDNSTLSSLSGLRGLDLAHNRLSNLTHSTLWPLRRSLQAVDLTNNSLTHLHPLAFRPLERLRALILAHNEVREVVGQLWLPQHLTMLDLRHCGLTSVRRCRLADLGDLTELDLGENPLECTCDLFFLQQSFQNSDTNQSQWRCQGQPSTGANSSSAGTGSGSGSGVSGLTAVADLGGQCQASYVTCPTVLELVKKMVAQIDIDHSKDTLVISWTLQAAQDLRIDGFQIRYMPEEKDPITSDIVPPDQRRLVLQTPGVAEHYVVCLDVIMYTSAVIHQECRSLQEISGNSMVVGILAGVIFLAPCIVILIFVFFKDNRMSKTPYYMIANAGDVEKQEPGHAVVAVSDGNGCGGGGGDSKAALVSKAGLVSHDKNGAGVRNGAGVVAGVVAVEEVVVKDTEGGSRAQDSDPSFKNVSFAEQHSAGQVRFAGSGEEAGCEEKGVCNQGFHADGSECTDHGHESTKM